MHFRKDFFNYERTVLLALSLLFAFLLVLDLYLQHRKSVHLELVNVTVGNVTP